MDDILMLLFLAVFVSVGVCLIRSIRRLVSSDKGRYTGYCRAAVSLLLLCVVVLPCSTDAMVRITDAAVTSGAANAFVQTVFSKRNYQVQYVLLFFLIWNDVILLTGWALFRMTDCFMRRKTGMDRAPILKPWEAVVGKWSGNFADGVLCVSAVFVTVSSISLFVKIGWLQQEQGAAVLCGWYLLPGAIWLPAAAFSGSFSYDSGKLPQKQEDKKEEREEEKAANAALREGKSAALTWQAFEREYFLTDFLLDCFQRRCRVAAVCRDEEQVREWTAALKKALGSRSDGICIPRIGEALQIRNQQDMDILVITADELLRLEPDRVYPFWFKQAGVFIAADTHALLASAGRQADALFALWNQRTEPAQYLFFGCSGSVQELQALTYYAVSRPWIFGAADEKTAEELVCWRLESPRGKMRRMLLNMMKEDGVPESQIKKRQEQLGMAEMGTEEFLKHAVSAVFPVCRIQNIYDSFLFREEREGLAAGWRIRLTDAAVEEKLKGFAQDGESTTEKEHFTEEGRIVFADECFFLRDKTPVGAQVRKGKKRVMLYQTAAVRRQSAVLSFPSDGCITDYTQGICIKQEETDPEKELVMLGVSMPTEEEDADSLSALLSLVCGQVLLTLFPYHKGLVKAACRRKDADRKEDETVFCRVESEEEQEPDGFVTLYILETDEWERGIAAVLKQDIDCLFRACIVWLRKAKEQPGGKERALLCYGASILAEDPKEDWCGRLLRHLEQASREEL